MDVFPNPIMLMDRVFFILKYMYFQLQNFHCSIIFCDFDLETTTAHADFLIVVTGNSSTKATRVRVRFGAGGSRNRDGCASS